MRIFRHGSSRNGQLQASDVRPDPMAKHRSPDGCRRGCDPRGWAGTARLSTGETMPARLLRFVVALALGLVGVGVAVAPPAAAADTFSITGTVTDAAGDGSDGIEGQCVAAYWI